MAEGNIMVMDEAHNASGDSNTGKILQDIIGATKGVTFLSATFAKRPDNMPIYAMKTAMSEANMNKTELVTGIEKGGVTPQEVLSAQLVQHGQMIRRERSFEGIEGRGRNQDQCESLVQAIAGIPSTHDLPELLVQVIPEYLVQTIPEYSGTR